MPPQRAKLHKTTGKLKTIPNLAQSPSTSSQPSTSREEDSESTRQFEIELCWCIQQYQLSIDSGKLNPKQIQDTEKNIKKLKGSAPLIQKRQLMRTGFGDYRSKMAAEEKTMGMINKKIKFTTTVPSKKSFFVKKSALLSLGNEFKFNFAAKKVEEDSPDTVALEEKLETCNLEEKSIEVRSEVPEKNIPSNFTPTGNEFRFNFSVQ